jgi:hypothetical protein
MRTERIVFAIRSQLLSFRLRSIDMNTEILAMVNNTLIMKNIEKNGHVMSAAGNSSYSDIDAEYT